MALRESRERFREAESQRERVRERAERVRESQRDREQREQRDREQREPESQREQREIQRAREREPEREQRESERQRAERARESQRDREQSVFLALCVTLTTRLTGELRAGIQIVCCEQVFRADSRRNELMPADDFSRLVCQVLRT